MAAVLLPLPATPLGLRKRVRVLVRKLSARRPPATLMHLVTTQTTSVAVAEMTSPGKVGLCAGAPAAAPAEQADPARRVTFPSESVPSPSSACWTLDLSDLDCLRAVAIPDAYAFA